MSIVHPWTFISFLFLSFSFPYLLFTIPRSSHPSLFFFMCATFSTHAHFFYFLQLPLFSTRRPFISVRSQHSSPCFFFHSSAPSMPITHARGSIMVIHDASVSSPRAVPPNVSFAHITSRLLSGDVAGLAKALN